MAILAGGNRHYFLSEIMPITAERSEEIRAAQKYYYNLHVANAGKRIGPEREIWREGELAAQAYKTSLLPEEREIYFADNATYNAMIADQIERERATASREHSQDFTVKAATFVAAGLAAPLFFGPATGGLYASGSAAGGAAAAGGTGSVALTPSEDVAAAAMENQTWTDAASVAMENQPAVSVASSGGLGKVLGDIVGGAAKILPAVAAVIPKVGAAINVFGGGTVQTPGTSQPVAIPTGSPGLPGLPESMDQPYNIFMPGSAGQPGTGTAPPIFFQTAADGSTTPNYLFYIAIAIVGFILLKKR